MTTVAIRRLVHERHELVWEAWHCATDADTPYVGAPADSAHPASLADVTLHNRAPATQFYDASRGAVLLGKLGLLVIAAAITALMNGLSKQPLRPQAFVEGYHAEPGHLRGRASTADFP